MRALNITIGLLIVLTGGIVLLSELDIIYLGSLAAIAFLILYLSMVIGGGVLVLNPSIIKAPRALSITIGLSIVLIGAIALLSNLGYIYLGGLKAIALPIIFIVLGGVLLLNPSIIKDPSVAAYFSFKKIISTYLIKLIYILGACVLGILGLYLLLLGDKYMLLGIGIIVLGNILWRLLCEGWILLFGIYDALISIENELKKK